MEVLSSNKNRFKFNKPDEFIEKLQWNNHKVEFKYFKNHEGAIVYVYSPLLKENNYRLALKGTTLSLIIYERREIVKPTYIEVINKTIHDKSAYERLKSYKYTLPDGNLRIDKTCWNSNKRRVEGYLSCKEKCA